MLLLTLRGTPTLYYGDELGLPDVPMPAEPRSVDVGGAATPSARRCAGTGRPHGGLHDRRAVAADGHGRRRLNVEAQRADPRSMLTLHRRLLALRRARPALAIGHWADVPAPDGVLAYRRSVEGQALLVVANLTDRPRDVALPAGTWRVVLSTGLDREDEALIDRLPVRADEGLILAPAG